MTAEQITRLEQLTLQQRLQIAGSAYLFRFSDVATATALTDGESNRRGNTRYEEIQKAYSEQAAAQKKKLFSPEQDAKLQELLDKPFEGKFPVVNPWGGGFAPAPQ